MYKRQSTSIVSFSKDTFVYYSTNKDISPNVREFFVKAAAMYGEMEETQVKLKEMSDLRENYVKEQDRMRKNIDTVGSTSVQGKEYIIKLASVSYTHLPFFVDVNAYHGYQIQFLYTH